ncbi:hypothetical protein GN958_ATG02763 [Phytophthora infestans]|nr:hypothetical protein GN958_ATG02763 [Phytophthora infestans]
MEDMSGRDLLKAIQEDIDYKDTLRLFVAQKSDKSWQTLTMRDAQRMRKKEPVPFVKELLVDENEMDPRWPLVDYHFPSLDAMQDSVHILVAKPGYVSVAPEWKPETMWGSSLETGTLPFVGRGRAAKKLQSIHYSNFTGARDRSGRTTWQIPLVDNVYGTGKTELGRKYIDQCRQALSNEKPQDPENQQELTSREPTQHRQPSQHEFLKQLCSCRTVLVRGTPRQFVVPPDLLKAKMNEALATAISELLQPGTMPATNASDAAYDFATELVRVLGPLFVVLDNVGEAFEDPRGDVVSRERFMDACKNVLVSWTQVPQLHLLVLGYADFLHDVVPDASLNSYMIVRLPMQWMTVNAIKEILCKTRVSSADTRTLSARWKLSTDEDLEDAATRLFAASSGHLQKIIKFISGYPTFASFCNFVDSGGDFNTKAIDFDHLYERVLWWQSTLKKWFGWSSSKKSRINLTHSVTDPNGDQVSARTVVFECHLLWEGTVEDAHISAHRVVMNIVVGVLRPLREYLIGLDTVRVFVTSRPEVVQWMCLKRMSQLFTKETTPRQELPQFFGEATVFDEFVGVQVSSQVKTLPNPWLGSYYVDNSRPFYSESFQPKDWPALVRHLECRLEDADEQRWSWFRGLKLTIVPDVIVLARTSPSEQELSPKVRMLRLGLAVATPVGYSTIIKECEKFENLLAKFDDMEVSADSVTSILVICATAFTDETPDDVRSQAFEEFEVLVETGFTHISQVLVLNLTTPARRAAFFGFDDNSMLAKIVETMVERSKIVPLFCGSYFLRLLGEKQHDTFNSFF